jgi:integrase
MPNQLIDLCKEYKLNEADKSLYVFGKQRRPSMDALSVNMFRYRFNKIRDELNLSKGIKFYSFKHTGASNLHNSGMPMRGLMDQLRHKKLDATQKYVKKHIGTVNERIRDEFPSPI